MNIADRIVALSPRVNCIVFMMEAPTWRKHPKGPYWCITLKWNGDKTKVEIEVEHENLEAGLNEAWAKFTNIAETGLPPGALLPSVEAVPQLDKPINDDIPF